MKRIKEFLALVLAVAMLVMALPVVASDLALTDYTEPITLTAYMGIGTAEPPDQQNNLFVKYVMDNFKIDISGTKFISSSDPIEEMGLMIASQDMPDLVCCYGGTQSLKIMQQFVDAGMVLEVENYLDTMMPNLKQDITDNSKDYYRAEDGKLYVIPSFGINPDNTEAKYTSEPNTAMVKRTDIWNDLGITENPQTPDELYEVLKKLATVTTEDGRAFIPYQTLGCMVSAPELGTYDDLEQVIGGMFGVWTHRTDINEEEKRFTSFQEFPEYLEFLKYAAKLYREGLLDPELFVNDSNMAVTRAKEGRVGIVAMWPNDIDIDTAAVRSVDADGMYNAIPVPMAEGVENTEYWQTSTIASMMTMINVNYPDPERLIKYLDWNVSPDGWTFNCYGAPGEKGESCCYLEDGKIIYDQETIDKKLEENSLYTGYVLGGWTYFMVGRVVYHLNHLNYANVTESPDAQRMEAREYNLSQVYMDPEWELVQGIAAGPIEEAKGTAVGKVFRDSYQKIVMEGKSDEEVTAMYETMMENAKSAGWLEIMQEQYELYQAWKAER